MPKTTLTNPAYTAPLDRMRATIATLIESTDSGTRNMGFSLRRNVEAIEDALVAHEPPVIQKEV